MVAVQLVDINRIVLDTENPRIKHFMEMHDEVTDVVMKLALGAGGDSDDEATAQDKYRQLKRAIKETGGVVQPIILKEGDDGTCLCIEGNTRVAIYRELDEESAPGDWTQILAIVHDELTEQQAHEIRLQVHLVGPRSWSPYAKGKYLYELWHQDKMPMTEILRVCGGTEKAVQTEIAAFEDMESYYRPVAEADGSEMFDYSRFSAFRELQRVKNSIYESGKSEHDFAEWVHKGLLRPQEKVRDLPKILKDTEATRIFLKSGAKEAERYLILQESESESVKSLRDASIVELASALRRRIERLSFDKSVQIASSPGSPEMLELDALRRSIDTLAETAEEE